MKGPRRAKNARAPLPRHSSRLSLPSSPSTARPSALHGARVQLAHDMKRFREHASPDEPAPKRSVSDVRKLSFAEAAALDGDVSFEPGCKLSQDILAALEWMTW